MSYTAAEQHDNLIALDTIGRHWFTVWNFISQWLFSILSLEVQSGWTTSFSFMEHFMHVFLSTLPPNPASELWPVMCSWYNRCPWKSPTRSFPTVSCLCSLNRKCLRSCHLLACAAAEWPAEPPKIALTGSELSHAEYYFGHQGVANSSSLEFMTAGVRCMDSVSNQYKLPIISSFVGVHLDMFYTNT